MKRVFGWHFSVTLYELGCLRKVQVSIAYDHAPCHVTSRHVADIWFGYCWQVRPVVSHLLHASLLFSTLRQNFQVTSVLEFFLYFCHTFFPFRFGKCNFSLHGEVCSTPVITLARVYLEHFNTLKEVKNLNWPLSKLYSPWRQTFFCFNCVYIRI